MAEQTNSKIMPPDEDRASSVPKTIDGWNTTIHYWDRKNKNQKMMLNPYAFYRGTDHLYWQDFGQHERLAQFGNERTVTWLSGDAHAYNAGSFYSQEHEAVVFGLNDPDESVIADYQLDLWRLAISFVLIGRENKNLSDEEAAKVIDALSASYLSTMRKLVDGEIKSDEPFTKHNTHGKLDDFLKIIEKKSSREKMLDKWAPILFESTGRRLFDLTSEKLGSATHVEKEALCLGLRQYWTTLQDADSIDPSKTKILDVARRLMAGTGSLGMDRFYVLIQDCNGVHRILDVKEQSKPCPLPFMGAAAQRTYDKHASHYTSQGKTTVRNCAKAVVAAAIAMSPCPNPYTGWLEMNGGCFYSVQERCPWKGSYPALLNEAKGKFKNLALDKPKRYVKLAEQMAAVFATHHANAHQTLQFDKNLETIIVELVDSQDDAFAKLVRSVAFEYADQVKSDHDAFKANLGQDMKTDNEAAG